MATPINSTSAFSPKCVLGLILISGLLICLVSCNKKENFAGPREKVTIAYATIPNAVLVHIAFVKGYFAEEGLDATPQPHAFGKPALAAVLDGKADLATVGDTPFVAAVMNGNKITTIALIQSSNRNEAIVARRDRGITTPAELRGKRIGVTLGTTGDYFADTFLLVHGLERKQVTVIDMKPDEMAAALDTGVVDAVSTWNPTLMQLEKVLGARGLLFYGDLFYTEIFCIAGVQEYVRKNPGVIQKILRALIKAETFVKQHDNEARALVAGFIKMDKAILDEMWHDMRFRVTLDQALLVNFEDQSRWRMKRNRSRQTELPNYLDRMYVDGLMAVKPKAVRIVR